MKVGRILFLKKSLRYVWRKNAVRALKVSLHVTKNLSVEMGNKQRSRTLRTNSIWNVPAGIEEKIRVASLYPSLSTKASF